MIKATMAVEGPGTVQVTLTLTTSLREWEELRTQLQNHYPSFALRSIIGKALADVQRTVSVEQQYEAP